MDCSKEESNCNEQDWGNEMFLQKLTMFKDSTNMSEPKKHHQLYQCCDEDLGNAILKWHADVVNLRE